jgi:hypothetical protein
MAITWSYKLAQSFPSQDEIKQTNQPQAPSCLCGATLYEGWDGVVNRVIFQNCNAFLANFDEVHFSIHENTLSWIRSVSSWCTWEHPAYSVHQPLFNTMANRWIREKRAVPEVLHYSDEKRRLLRTEFLKQMVFLTTRPPNHPKIKAFRWTVPRTKLTCRTPFYVVRYIAGWQFYRVGFVLQQCVNPFEICPVHLRRLRFPRQRQSYRYQTHCTWIRCFASLEHWLLARRLASVACSNFSEVYLFGECLSASTPFNVPTLPKDIWNLILSMVLSPDEIVENWQDQQAYLTRGFLELYPIP